MPPPATTAVPLAREVLPEIRAALGRLGASDAKVARAVLADPAAVVYMSVGDLAAVADTSASTVVRACQRLGFSGFQHLKIALAQESGTGTPLQRGAVSLTDAPSVTFEKVLSAGSQALSDAVTTVDAEAFEAATAAVAACERVLVLGVGASSAPAQDVAYRLNTIGVRAEAPVDIRAQTLAAHLLGARDVCLAISHTGATRETLACAEAAGTSGASVVTVTSFAHSPLAEVAEWALVAGGADIGFRLEAMTSRVAHLAVLDALVVATAVRSWERAGPALDAMAEITATRSY